MSLLLLLLACGAEPETPTWAEDVKPIVDQSCVSCHVEGGAGGFSLDSYEALSLVGAAAADAVAERRMPPWLPEEGCREYLGDRSLSEAEIDTLVRWVDGGMPQGDPALAADNAPQHEALEATHSASTPSYLPGTAEGDDYRCFLLDIDTSAPMYLTGSDVEPGSGLVHHGLVYAVGPEHAALLAELDGADGAPGYTCFGGPIPDTSAVALPTQLGAWVPGAAPMRLPEGLSTRIEAGSVVVMQLHYSSLGGAPEPDSSTLLLEMSPEPTDWLQIVAPLPIRALDIPAGERAAFTATFPYYGEQSLSLRGLGPHMHLLGESFQAWIEREQSEDECLLDIPAWDFEWQASYALPEADWAVLESGDRVGLTCAYDNTAENQPVVDGERIESRDVAWGDGSLDEMCLLYLSRVEPYSPPAAADALPCEGVEACEAGCEDPGSLECLLSCEAVADDCATCALGDFMECAAPRCGLSLLPAQECLQTCAISAAMLGGNLGRCMEAECPEAYAGALECLEPLFVGDCAPQPEACGL